MWRFLQSAAGVLATTLLGAPQALSIQKKALKRARSLCPLRGFRAILEQSDAGPFHITVLLSENKEDAAFSLRF